MQLVSKISNLCDHNPPTSQTDGRTDRQTEGQTTSTCNRKTALCTIVHRAVKTIAAVQRRCYSDVIHYARAFE